jgi:hypothetical protein
MLSGNIGSLVALNAKSPVVYQVVPLDTKSLRAMEQSQYRRQFDANVVLTTL